MCEVCSGGNFPVLRAVCGPACCAFGVCRDVEAASPHGRRFLDEESHGAPPGGDEGTKTPTRVILAETIHTMNGAQPNATAVAVGAQGKIVAIGSKEEVLQLRVPGTEVHDLGSRTVLPGFIDPHMHSNMSSMRPWVDCSPFENSSVAEVLGKLKAKVDTLKEGEWVQAKMLDPSLTPMEGKVFGKQLLDEIAPTNPVFVLESNGHNAYVNSLALKAASVPDDIEDPPTGRFVRCPVTNELTGRLEEPPAMLAFVHAMPQPTPAELIQMIREDLIDGAKRGCTLLHDCGIGALFGKMDLELIDAVVASNPPVRYAGLLVSTHMKTWEEMNLKPGPRQGDRLTITGIKAWADGSNQGKTGYLRKPYLHEEGRGALNYTAQQIDELLLDCHKKSWRVGIHANGDAAIDVVLDSFEKAIKGNPSREHRHRIEHCSILHPEQIKRMKELGLSPSFLIGHVHFWGKAFRDSLLGPERADMLDPCRSALDGGLRISLHSDYNVTPIDPLRCIQNAVVRDMREGGDILNDKECITPMEAIRAVTLDAAWQCHLDHICGSLEVGKRCDLVVLEEDPCRVEPQAISNIEVHSTWLDGECRIGAEKLQGLGEPATAEPMPSAAEDAVGAEEEGGIPTRQRSRAFLGCDKHHLA